MRRRAAPAYAPIPDLTLAPQLVTPTGKRINRNSSSRFHTNVCVSFILRCNLRSQPLLPLHQSLVACQDGNRGGDSHRRQHRRYISSLGVHEDTTILDARSCSLVYSSGETVCHKKYYCYSTTFTTLLPAWTQRNNVFVTAIAVISICLPCELVSHVCIFTLRLSVSKEHRIMFMRSSHSDHFVSSQLLDRNLSRYISYDY